MSEWKALRKASGTGWKELERESGTGRKALEWEYEDFTTFTEVDIGADRIQKTANHIDHLAYRDETTYLYRDYGANQFGDFTHKIKIKAISVDDWSQGHSWMLANDVGECKTLHDASKTFINIDLYYDSANLCVELNEDHNGTLYIDKNIGGFNVGDWIYIKFVKSGTSLTAYLYSDDAYSVLVDTLSLTLQADHQFRYLYGCNTYNSGLAGSALNQDIENFDLG